MRRGGIRFQRGAGAERGETVALRGHPVEEAAGRIICGWPRRRRGLSCGWKPCDSYRFQPNANIGVRAYRRICRAPFGWLFEKLLSDGLTIGSARPPALLNLNPKVLAMPRACNKQNSDRVPGCCYLTDGLGYDLADSFHAAREAGMGVGLNR